MIYSIGFGVRYVSVANRTAAPVNPKNSLKPICVSNLFRLLVTRTRISAFTSVLKRMWCCLTFRRNERIVRIRKFSDRGNCSRSTQMLYTPHQNVQIGAERANSEGGQKAPSTLHAHRRLQNSSRRVPVVRAQPENAVLRAGNAGKGRLGVRQSARGKGGGRDLQLRDGRLRKTLVHRR